MAGDWIKMRNDLCDDPAVISVARAVDVGEDLVVGKLHRLWSWADRHTKDGNASGVTASWINRFVSVTGFAEAMVEAGWLVINEAGVRFPNFEKHNGESSKQRALTAKRVARYKASKRVTQRPLPREEKRREEIDTPIGVSRAQKFTAPTVEQVTAYCVERGNAVDPQKFFSHYESNGWRVGKNPMRDWRAAVRTWEKSEFSKPQRAEPLSGLKAFGQKHGVIPNDPQ